VTCERDYRGRIRRSAQGARESPTWAARGLRIFLSWFPVGRSRNENRCDRRHRPDWLEKRRHLRQGGHDVIAASPKARVNTITADGLKEALAGAHVVIDLSNSLSFDLKAVLYGALLDG
jgi:hypothetical protein